MKKKKEFYIACNNAVINRLVESHFRAAIRTTALEHAEEKNGSTWGGGGGGCPKDTIS